MWRARPVFISSTFVDMQAERDYLRTRVFPELEERLRANRHHLEWVDLRVGVAVTSQPDEQGRELHVLKVCLAEVKRCRPFLVVLLGDRYGWVPPPDRVRDAAREVGFSADITGRSVTDLEIDFGILSDSEQPPRSMFYFREPLPYSDTPPETAALFSDAFASDAGAADRARRLALLKQRIAQQLPDRVRRYAARWDAERRQVTGLESWGRMVLEDIWSELEGEIQAAQQSQQQSRARGARVESDAPWQQVELEALEDFVDDRARDFVGRRDILAQLLGFATAASPTDTNYGRCITGDPGSGKSALFSALYRRLVERDAFLLAHAAGASIQAASVDAMLRRWSGELAKALGIDLHLPEHADPDTVEMTFASLLARMAVQRRVVLLIDALDQFEATTRGQYVTWLPRLWPANARLLATAIAGTASAALAQRQRIEIVPLPPLDAAEARDIATAICRRYHREFEPQVFDTLLAKSGPNGPAWGNPLWLVLAVEELNLLDADDFARARHYEGAAAEQLRALMLDHVASFPGDIIGLYRHTFDRVEGLFGVQLTLGFLGLIAVSRFGWRESDFRLVLPRVSGELWDPLRFAQLRRLFRGQMRLRGALAQWDFNHAQMRTAVRTRLAALGIAEQQLHAMIADRLLSCPLDDPIRITETMVHLIGSEDWARAAQYYGDGSLTEPETEGATRALAQSLLDDPTELNAAINVLHASPTADVLRAANKRYLNLLLPAVDGRVSAATRVGLAGAIHVALDRLHEQYPRDLTLNYDLALTLGTLADGHFDLGDLERAQNCYQMKLQLANSLADQGISDEGFEVAVTQAIVGAHDRLGRIAWLRGDSRGAAEAYRKSFSIAIDNSKRRPRDLHLRHSAAIGLENLAGEQTAIGDLSSARKSLIEALALLQQSVNEEPDSSIWQRSLAMCHGQLGDAELALGNVKEAQSSFATYVGIFQKLVDRDPANANWQRDLATAHDRLGDIRQHDDLTGAETEYRLSLAIRSRLVDLDSANWLWQRDHSISHRKLGYALERQHDLKGAESMYMGALAISERLAEQDKTNAQGQRDIAVCLNDVGDILLALDDLERAADAFVRAIAITERLLRQNLQDTDWQRDLGISYNRLGKIQMKLGKFDQAVDLYQSSLAVALALVRRDPNNSNWLNDCATDYHRLGEAQEASGDASGSRRSFWKSNAMQIHIEEKFGRGQSENSRGRSKS